MMKMVLFMAMEKKEAITKRSSDYKNRKRTGSLQG